MPAKLVGWSESNDGRLCQFCDKCHWTPVHYCSLSFILVRPKGEDRCHVTLGSRLSDLFCQTELTKRRALMPYSNNISKKEVARIVSVIESTIVRWANAGKFPIPFVIEGRTFFYRPKVDNWLVEKRERRGFPEAFAVLDAIVKQAK